MLLTWLADSYIWVRATEQERAALGLKQPHGIGYGVGLAFALFAMQGTSSKCRIRALTDFLFRGVEFGELILSEVLYVRSSMAPCIDEQSLHAKCV